MFSWRFDHTKRSNFAYRFIVQIVLFLSVVDANVFLEHPVILALRDYCSIFSTQIVRTLMLLLKCLHCDVFIICQINSEIIELQQSAKLVCYSCGLSAPCRPLAVEIINPLLLLYWFVPVYLVLLFFNQTVSRPPNRCNCPFIAGGLCASSDINLTKPMVRWFAPIPCVDAKLCNIHGNYKTWKLCSIFI